MVPNSLTGSTFVAFVCAASLVCAQENPRLSNRYPLKPVRIVLTTSPGSGLDSVVRRMAQGLTERWGQAVIVDNRPGAAGTVALEILARATPDGYTFGTISVSVMNGWMTQKSAPFNVRAFTPVVQLTSLPYLVVVNNTLPVTSIKELIEYARSRPGVLNYGSPGVGSAAHLGMALFTAVAGVDMVHVPYAGSTPALIDLIAGRTHVQINNIVASSSLVKQGKIRALAVTGATRAQTLPHLPTVSEAGLPGYELDNMQGLLGPAGIAPATVLALNREVSAIINTPEVRSQFAADGAEAAPPHSPAAFGEKLAQQADKWAAIILKRGAKY
ncbi:MAG: tripartite tricarboxylate transporter substrate binding protein [Betaproteobacteria bacterium]|nr:tripartite tricarboxylate transporter substrate binding protein [Betaproteobacteria bacterium]